MDKVSSDGIKGLAKKMRDSIYSTADIWKKLAGPQYGIENAGIALKENELRELSKTTESIDEGLNDSVDQLNNIKGGLAKLLSLKKKDQHDQSAQEALPYVTEIKERRTEEAEIQRKCKDFIANTKKGLIKILQMPNTEPAKLKRLIEEELENSKKRLEPLNQEIKRLGVNVEYLQENLKRVKDKILGSMAPKDQQDVMTPKIQD